MVAAHGSFTHAARRNRPLVEAFMQLAIDTARVDNARRAR